MCWENEMVTGWLETGAAQDDFDNDTWSGSGSVNAPFAKCPGSETDSDASPAVEITFAVVEAVYVASTPGVNAPNDAGAPRVSANVAGTEPPAPPTALVAAASSAPE